MSFTITPISDQLLRLKNIEKHITYLQQLATRYVEVTNLVNPSTVRPVISQGWGISGVVNDTITEYNSGQTLPELLSIADAQQNLYESIKQELYNYVNTCIPVFSASYCGSFHLSGYFINLTPEIFQQFSSENNLYITAYKTDSSLTYPDSSENIQVKLVPGSNPPSSGEFYLDAFNNIILNDTDFTLDTDYVGQILQYDSNLDFPVPLAIDSNFGPISIEPTLTSTHICFSNDFDPTELFGVLDKISLSGSNYLPDGTYTLTAVSSSPAYITIANIVDPALNLEVNVAVDDSNITLEKTYDYNYSPHTTYFNQLTMVHDLGRRFISVEDRLSIYTNLSKSIKAASQSLRNLNSFLKTTRIDTNYDLIHTFLQTIKSYTTSIFTSIYDAITITNYISGYYTLSGLYHEYNFKNAKINPLAYGSLMNSVSQSADADTNIASPYTVQVDSWMYSQENVSGTAVDGFIKIPLPIDLSQYLLGTGLGTYIKIDNLISTYFNDPAFGYYYHDPILAVRVANFSVAEPYYMFTIEDGFLILNVNYGGNYIQAPAWTDGIKERILLQSDLRIRVLRNDHDFSES